MQRWAKIKIPTRTHAHSDTQWFPSALRSSIFCASSFLPHHQFQEDSKANISRLSPPLTAPSRNELMTEVYAEYSVSSPTPAPQSTSRWHLPLFHAKQQRTYVMLKNK
ncbi:hypothetical protein E2C01_094347 [Portunus trituberculatus]|uniref:Uncharacterized protein n=1 Tax=Portunus trituberculatus TaxID=210409 RepID=A0A5B7JXB8_PORTR|nr:hypothetical protein [Portunus trituberculatus]